MANKPKVDTSKVLIGVFVIFAIAYLFRVFWVVKQGPRVVEVVKIRKKDKPKTSQKTKSAKKEEIRPKTKEEFREIVRHRKDSPVRPTAGPSEIVKEKQKSKAEKNLQTHMNSVYSKWFGEEDPEVVRSKLKSFREDLMASITGDPKVTDPVTYLMKKNGYDKKKWQNLPESDRQDMINNLSRQINAPKNVARALERHFPNAPYTRMMRAQAKMLDKLSKYKPEGAPEPEEAQRIFQNLQKDPDRMARFMEEMADTIDPKDPNKYYDLLKRYR